MQVSTAMAARVGRIGAAVVLAGVAVLGGVGVAPAVAAPVGAAPASGPAAGSVLQTGEFFGAASGGAQSGKFRFTGRGDGQSANWSLAVDLFDPTMRDCLGVGDLGVDLIGLMNRDGRGPFGGHVGLVRIYGFQANNRPFVPVHDMTGDELLGCLRLVRPDLPAGAAFTLADREHQSWPAGAGAADGTFDLVTYSDHLGYMVHQWIPGRGWQHGASIGGHGMQPSVVRQRDGSLRIFVAGGGSHVYSAVITRDRRFSGWRSLGGGVLAAAAPLLNLDGSVSAYVLGTDHQVYQGLIAASGLFKGWIPLGKPPRPPDLLPSSVTLKSQIAAVGTGGGRVTLVGAASFHSFAKSYANGRWGAWQMLPDRINEVGLDGLSGVSPAAGQVLLAWGTNERQAHVGSLRNGQWGPTTNLGGTVDRIFASQIGARTDLWTDGVNGALYQRTAKAGHWGAWIVLPMSTPF